jgi:hypothetical protein
MVYYSLIITKEKQLQETIAGGNACAAYAPFARRHFEHFSDW